jgi:hypothetical protein
VIHRHSTQYEAVLASDRRRLLRAEVIRRGGYRCQACSRGGRLDAHHARGYRNLGRERPEELQVLCRECHAAVHDSHRVANAGWLKLLLWLVVIAVATHLGLCFMVS